MFSDGNLPTICGQTNQSGQLFATGGNFAAGIGGGDGGPGSDIFVATTLVVKAGTSTPLSDDNIVEHTTDTDIAGELNGKQYVTTEAPAPVFVDEGLKFEVTSLDPKNVKVIANDYTSKPYTIPATVTYLEDTYTVTAIEEDAFAGVGTADAPADLLLPADWSGTKPAATATLWYGGYFVDFREATIAAIKEASYDAEAEINNAADGFVDVEDVKKAKNNAAAAFEDAKATADNSINAAADMENIKNAKYKAELKITEATDNALTAIEAAIESYKATAVTEIESVAAETKNAINALAVYSPVKNQAINEIDKAVAEAETSITNATSQDDVNEAINDAQTKINQQLANVQAYYNQLQAAKAVAIHDVDKAAADAEAAINKAAEGYGNIQDVQHVVVSSKAQIEEVKNIAHFMINAETVVDEVGPLKENSIKQIKKDQNEAVGEIQAAIASLKQNAIDDVQTAADAAKEEIHGFDIEESAKIEAKAAIDAIVAKAENDINTATSFYAIDEAKTKGIADMMDICNELREQERLAALDAVTVTQTAEDDFSYLLEDHLVFTIDGDNVNTTVNNEDKPGFTLSETVAITICPAHTFKLTANQDSAHPENFYSTFFTSEGAYKVPETADAYAGTLNNEKLKITDIGNVIHKSEAVMLKSNQNDIILMPSCNKDAATENNDLIGTDKGKTLGEGDFALSFGENGVGFYNWNGKPIGDNEAYLTSSLDVENIVIVPDGVFVEITEQNDNVVTLYGLKTVEFIKVNDTPSVRVTYENESTKTYAKPKNVRFGKE